MSIFKDNEKVLNNITSVNEEKIKEITKEEVNSKLGSTDISGIGDGTVTGAISAVNGNLLSCIKNLKETSTVINSSDSTNLSVVLTGNLNSYSCITGYLFLYKTNAVLFPIPFVLENGNDGHIRYANVDIPDSMTSAITVTTNLDNNKLICTFSGRGCFSAYAVYFVSNEKNTVTITFE